MCTCKVFSCEYLAAMSALVWFFTCMDSFMSNLGLQVTEFVFAVFTGMFFLQNVLSSAFKLLKPFLHCSQEYGLSSMCSSMIPSHWICFCSVHRDMIYLQNVLSSAFRWLKSFLHCSQGYGFSPVCALQGFQVTEFVFAVFTGIWFIFRMCSQVLSNG